MILLGISLISTTLFLFSKYNFVLLSVTRKKLEYFTIWLIINFLKKLTLKYSCNEIMRIAFFCLHKFESRFIANNTKGLISANGYSMITTSSSCISYI